MLDEILGTEGPGEESGRSPPAGTMRNVQSLGEPDLFACSRALVIGASEYRSLPWTRLPEVKKDVVAVSEALEEHGFEVTRLEDPDHRVLKERVEDFVTGDRVQSKDRLLVYFAGHGSTYVSPHGVETGFLVPVDSSHSQAPEIRGLSMGSIHEFCRRSIAHQILFLFDSCFAGELLKTLNLRAAAPPFIKDRALKPVRQFITSGQADEVVPDSSVFRKTFVQALRGEADEDKDGYFTALQLADYLSKTVVNKTHEAQHPQYGRSLVPGHDQGDFIFRIPEKWIAKRVEVPEAPEGRPELEAIEQAAQAIEPQIKSRQTSWERWLEDMERDFHKCLDFEKRLVPPEMKVRIWTRFYHGYPAESPFSTRDREMREAALRHIEALKSRGSISVATLRSVPESGVERVDSPLDVSFRSVLPGSFSMGSPHGEHGRNDDEKVHTVHLTRGYWIAETPITQRQWRLLMGTNPSHFSDCGDACPVERVSWYSAAVFANRLSESAGLEPCYEIKGLSESKSGEVLSCERVLFKGLDSPGYRLPTEAEWEFAARAGSQGPFWTGDDLRTDQANYDGNYPYRGEALSSFRERTTPVRHFGPNPWGLYDVHGNVAEWVWDAYSPYPSDPVSDPLGSGDHDRSHEKRRVIRGGGWLDDAAGCRSADRLPASPGFRDSNVGFRIVRSFRHGSDN